MTDLNPDFKSYLDKADDLTISNPAKAETYLLKLLKKSKFSLKEILQLKIKLGYALWSESKTDDSYKIYLGVGKQARENSFEEETADSLEGIALFAGLKGNIKEGLEQVQEAIKIYKNLNLQNKEAKASNNYGIILYYNNQLDEALVWFNNALKLSTNKKSTYYISALGNSALIFRARGEMQKALDFITRGYNLAKEIGLNRAISTFQNNMADTLRSVGNYVESKKNYEEALTRAREANDKRNIGMLSIGYANYWIELGDLDQSFEYLKDGLQIYDEMDDPFGKILTYDGFAHYWSVKGNLKKAEKYLLKALELNEKISVLELQVSILVLLAEIYEGLKRPNEAYHYLELANTLAREKKSNLARAEVLLQRGRNLINSSQFNEAKLVLDEALWLSKEIPHIEIQLISMMLLSRCYLIRFVKNSLDTSYYDLAIKYIQDTLKLTKEKNLIPNYIHALVIRGMLYSINSENDNAERSLHEAMELAKERDMTIQVRKMQDQLSILRSSTDDKIPKQQFKNIIISFAMEELRKATTSYVEATMTEIDLEDTFLITYKLDDKWGPVIHNVENLNVNDPGTKQTLAEVGAVYSFSIGQGQEYNEGLFGPLPFGKDKQAIIYAKMMNDSSNTIKRLDGKNFILFTLVFPSKMVQFFYDRQKLTHIFENEINFISSVQEIDNIFLNKLRKKIMSEFMKDLSGDFNPLKNGD
jgi:tetratricopeptide (TPR) repeat protein